MQEKKRLFGLLSLLFILALSALGAYRALNPHPAPGRGEPQLQPEPLPTTVDYEAQVRPLLDRRCVVCHGCYDAPCQLKLSSMTGLRRGASEALVYNPTRIEAMPPSRLFIDGKSTAAWRQRGFHPVLNEAQPTPTQNLDNSVLYRLLKQKQLHPQPTSGRLSEQFTLGLNREQTCPTPETVDDFTREHPLWGMPYALPNLSEEEYQTLTAWLALGAPAPSPSGPSAMVVPQIEQWETFFNQPGNKQRLVSRYLYEHLFHAHIHFSGSPAREFYRLVRSSTPPGQTSDEIATLRPYDDPGPGPFYYRLLKYQPSIVIKNHLVYEFSAARLQRFRELFLKLDYRVTELPGYDPAIASNPFKTFYQLPITSRYRLLLDDAHFFVEGFIKGPVCRGQIALDVIEDRFWVVFFDPQQQVFTNDAQFIGKVADDLQLPAVRQSSLDITGIWRDYWDRWRRYMLTKQSLFEQVGTHDIQHALGHIWQGNDGNPNAALTVFRHLDSASVVYGLVGAPPDTAWIIDYPLFERIHYLLVAGYNVYGNVVHQANTRIYMDFLRMEGEDYFLSFLPAEYRQAIRDKWYSGLHSGIEKLFSVPQDWLTIETVTGYRTDKPQAELYRYLQQRLSDSAAAARTRNRCGIRPCPGTPTSESKNRADRAMTSMAALHGVHLQAFPDVSFVRVTTDNPQQDMNYSLIRNKAYQNVLSFLPGNMAQDRADIRRDSMTVVDWLEGSYPNFFFSVPLNEIEDFAAQCTAVQTAEDFQALIERYGFRRTNPGFWAQADGFQDSFAREKPVLSGLFDLNRYQDL